MKLWECLLAGVIALWAGVIALWLLVALIIVGGKALDAIFRLGIVPWIIGITGAGLLLGVFLHAVLRD